MLAATPDQIQVFAGEHVSLLQSRLDFVKESHEKGAREWGARNLCYNMHRPHFPSNARHVLLAFVCVLH